MKIVYTEHLIGKIMVNFSIFFLTANFKALVGEFEGQIMPIYWFTHQTMGTSMLVFINPWFLNPYS